jgi:hypothetical protein
MKTRTHHLPNPAPDRRGDPPCIAANDLRVLSNAEIAETVRDSFTPHRCVVEFQDAAAKLALRLYALDGREFCVEGKRVEPLRDPDALAAYLADLKAHLATRNLTFNSHEAAVRRRAKR